MNNLKGETTIKIIKTKMAKKKFKKVRETKRPPMVEHILGIALIVLLFAADRLTKDYAPNKIFNYGISFSLFPGIIPIIVALSVIFLFILIAIYSDLRKKIENSILLDFGFIFLIAGTLGNLFDRIVYGYVIDFVTISSYFPSFNLADVFNLIGVVLFITFLIKNSK